MVHRLQAYATGVGSIVNKRDTFLLRLDPKILAALRRWSEDDLRSVNGQIEYLLRVALQKAGRLKSTSDHQRPDTDSPGSKDTEG